MKIQYGILAVGVLVCVFFGMRLIATIQDSTRMQPETLSTPVQKTDNQLPEMTIDKAKQYTAVIHTTAGDITVSLYPKETPVTVNNFVHLARTGFYDKTVFHRVIKGFMIQGGDPKGNGTGGPGYKFDDEPITREYLRGTVAMANSGPNTNGSQFFIMHADYALPKQYVIFGMVSTGLEVVDAIATAPIIENTGTEASSPVLPVAITAIDILEQ